MTTAPTDVAINVMARQLLLDAIQQQHDEAGDGYDHTGTCAGIPDGYTTRIVNEARDIAANLAPSPDTLTAAQHLLGVRPPAIPTPVPPGQSETEADTPSR